MPLCFVGVVTENYTGERGMSKGWIRLHRQLQDCWIWKNDKGESFSRGQAWIDLLLMANHEDRKIYLNGELVKIHRGQFHTSIIKLADRWNWGRNRVTRFLDLLASDMMIERTSDTINGTTITIVKYNDFQDYRATDEATDEAMSEANVVQISCINNNDKELKNKKDSRAKFTPPTVDEVRAYCQERKNNVDPDRFVDFYSSKGWMVGKNKMKDWKSAVRTWEKSEKKKPGDKFNNFEGRNYDFKELEDLM